MPGLAPCQALEVARLTDTGTVPGVLSSIRVWAYRSPSATVSEISRTEGRSTAGASLLAMSAVALMSLSTAPAADCSTSENRSADSATVSSRIGTLTMPMTCPGSSRRLPLTGSKSTPDRALPESVAYVISTVPAAGRSSSITKVAVPSVSSTVTSRIVANGDPLSRSLSWMNTVAEPVASAALIGLLSVSRKVSSDSAWLSFTIGTRSVWRVCPGSKTRRPRMLM